MNKYPGHSFLRVVTFKPLDILFYSFFSFISVSTKLTNDFKKPLHQEEQPAVLTNKHDIIYCL